MNPITNLSGADSRKTAYHEAGHAVVATLHGLHVSELSALAHGSIYGWTTMDALPPDATLKEKDAHACIYLAGCLAELRLRDQATLPRDPNLILEQLVGDPDYYDDMSKVERILLEGSTTDEQAVERLCRFIDETLFVLANSWGLVDAVASALIARESLSGAELREILRGQLKPHS